MVLSKKEPHWLCGGDVDQDGSLMVYMCKEPCWFFVDVGRQDRALVLCVRRSPIGHDLVVVTSYRSGHGALVALYLANPVMVDVARSRLGY